jgi:hypothetical protein
VIPTGDVAVRLAGAAPVTIPLASLRRGGGRMLADAMGLALGSSPGTRGDVPLRIDIPTAQGTIVFQSWYERAAATAGSGRRLLR